MQRFYARDRRRRLLVDKYFQSRIIAAFVLAIVISINFGVVFMYLASSFFPGSDHKALWVLASIEILASVAAIFWAARLSNKSAGPIYAIKRELERLGRGHLGTPLKLRASDYFPHLADSYNSARASLCNRIQRIQSLVDQLCAQPISDTEMKKILQQLQEETSYFRTQPDKEGPER